MTDTEERKDIEASTNIKENDASTSDGKTEQQLPEEKSTDQKSEEENEESENEEDIRMKMNDRIQSVLKRLEAVADKLEKVGVGAPVQEDEETEDYPAITAFDETFNKFIEKMEKAAKEIHKDMVDMTQFVRDVFAATRKIILVGCRCSKPDDANAIYKYLIEATNAGIEWCDKNWKTKYVNQGKAIHEAMTLFTWPTVGASGENFCYDMQGSVEFNTNKILREFLNSDQTQVEWTRALVGLCKAIPTYINDYHKGGIKFNPRGKKATPEMFKVGTATAEAPKKEVKPEPKPEPKPAAKPNPLAGKIAPKAAKPKTPSMVRKGGLNQISVEYYTEAEVKVQSDDLKVKIDDIVSVAQCNKSIITIPTKVKAISILGCQGSIFNIGDVIGTLELNAVKKSKIYLEGTVKLITCDKCESLEIYFNKESLGCQVITSLSSSINLEYPDPKEEGNYLERPIPEQIKVTFDDKSNLINEVYVHE